MKTRYSVFVGEEKVVIYGWMTLGEVMQFIELFAVSGYCYLVRHENPDAILTLSKNCPEKESENG